MNVRIRVLREAKRIPVGKWQSSLTLRDSVEEEIEG